METKNPKPPFYFTETPRNNRVYVYYVSVGTKTKTLFDICESDDAARAAIELHKSGKHPTQWTPGCGWDPS